MKDIQFKITKNEQVNQDTIRLVITADEKLPAITAGQFLQLEVPDNTLILRRPFCIYDYDGYSITLYVAVVGKGTEALKKAKVWDALKAILPLGNGFFNDGSSDAELLRSARNDGRSFGFAQDDKGGRQGGVPTWIDEYKNIGILGGGIGCAPLYRITKDYPTKNFFAYLGFNTKDRILFTEDYKKTCKKLVITTADGTAYEKGYALDYIKKDLSQLDAIIMCGPHGLVKAAKTALADTKIPVFVSLEERMACGVGACLVCTCPIEVGGATKNKRVCFDGPVFSLQEVIV